MTLILTGFKNCGKSSVGRALAAAHGRHLLDTDDMIVKAHGDGDSAADVFLSVGKEAFRRMEADVVQAIEGAYGLVVATGGGAMMHPQNAAHLKNLGRVYYIKLDQQTLYKRMMSGNVMPAFIDKDDPEASFQNYHQERAARYEAVADHIIDGAGKTPADIADEIATLELENG